MADYRPRNPPIKIKKIDGTMTLELERTEDILGSARGVFGFERAPRGLCGGDA
ncbi:MAG: hypothetical protein R3F31_03170 [Verrucomicrobiales bacterium]